MNFQEVQLSMSLKVINTLVFEGTTFEVAARDYSKAFIDLERLVHSWI